MQKGTFGMPPEEGRYPARGRKRNLFLSRQFVTYSAAGLVGLVVIGGILLLLLRKPHVPPPPVESTIVLPEPLGGKTHTAALEKLAKAAQRYDLNAKTLRLTLTSKQTTAAPSIAVGEWHTVTFESKRECFAALLDIDSEGKFQLIYPHPETSDPKLHPGELVKLPVQVTPPAGQQEFLLVTSEQPVKIEDIVSGPADSYTQHLSVALLPYFAREK